MESDLSYKCFGTSIQLVYEHVIQFGMFIQYLILLEGVGFTWIHHPMKRFLNDTVFPLYQQWRTSGTQKITSVG